MTQPERTLPAVAQERGVSSEAWTTLKEVMFPKASERLVALYVDYCRAAGIDIMLAPFAIVKSWDNQAQESVESLWKTVVFYRIVAHRTGEYAGYTSEIGPKIESEFKDKSGKPFKVIHPEWAKATVCRMVKGQACHWTAEIDWIETFAKVKGGGPNPIWRQRPKAQLIKCAEAAALRLAFPEIGDGSTEDEASHVGFDNAIDVTDKDDKGTTTTQKKAPVDRLHTQTYETDGVVHDADGVVLEGLIEHHPEDPLQMSLLDQKEHHVLRPMEDITTAAQFVEELMMVDSDLGEEAWPRYEALKQEWVNRLDRAAADGKEIKEKVRDNVGRALAEALIRLQEATEQEALDSPAGEAEMETLDDPEAQADLDVLAKLREGREL